MNKIWTPLTAERIVDASITLIRESGVEALSMRALATSLGVTAPALYAHFTSRDQLLRALTKTPFPPTRALPTLTGP